MIRNSKQLNGLTVADARKFHKLFERPFTFYFACSWSLSRTFVLTNTIIKALLNDKKLHFLSLSGQLLKRFRHFELYSFSMNRPEFSLFFKYYVLRYFQDEVTQLMIWLFQFKIKTFRAQKSTKCVWLESSNATESFLFNLS